MIWRVMSASRQPNPNPVFIDYRKCGWSRELRLVNRKDSGFSKSIQTLVNPYRWSQKPKPQAPNQALQRMNCIVTDRAPSSTLRANAVHR